MKSSKEKQPKLLCFPSARLCCLLVALVYVSLSWPVRAIPTKMTTTSSRDIFSALQYTRRGLWSAHKPTVYSRVHRVVLKTVTGALCQVQKLHAAVRWNFAIALVIKKNRTIPEKEKSLNVTTGELVERATSPWRIIDQSRVSRRQEPATSADSLCAWLPGQGALHTAQQQQPNACRFE